MALTSGQLLLILVHELLPVGDAVHFGVAIHGLVERLVTDVLGVVEQSVSPVPETEVADSYAVKRVANLGTAVRVEVDVLLDLARFYV